MYRIHARMRYTSEAGGGEEANRSFFRWRARRVRAAVFSRLTMTEHGVQ